MDTAAATFLAGGASGGAALQRMVDSWVAEWAALGYSVAQVLVKMYDVCFAYKCAAEHWATAWPRCL
jgi:hypothetical protein